MNLIGKCTLISITLMYSFLILKIQNIGILIIIIYLWYLKINEDRKAKTIIKMYDILDKV